MTGRVHDLYRVGLDTRMDRQERHAFRLGEGWMRSVCGATAWTVKLADDRARPWCATCRLIVTAELALACAILELGVDEVTAELPPANVAAPDALADLIGG